jgi:hypothetical protein
MASRTDDDARGVNDPPAHTVDDLLWADPAWRAEALDWIASALGAHGLAMTGETVVPRVMPWSLTARIPTDHGPVWFKCNAPGGGFEPALMLALSRWVPEFVLTPLAVDPDRSWSLLGDGGPILHQAMEAEPDLGRWEAVLTDYACLQRAVAPQVGALIADGVPDLRPEALPARLDALLADPVATLDLGGEGGMSAQTYRTLCELRPAFARWCDRLAEAGVPASLDHADLHEGNVLLGRERYGFYDWGDASIGHPFTSLLVVSRVAAERFGLVAGASELARLRDAYLEPWTAEHPRADLRGAVGLAVRLGAISRAVTWQRTFPGTPEPVRRVHAAHVARWLTHLLEPTLY